MQLHVALDPCLVPYAIRVLLCNDSHLEEEEKKEKEAAERTASVKETLPTVKSGVLQDVSNKIKRISAKVSLGHRLGEGVGRFENGISWPPSPNSTLDNTPEHNNLHHLFNLLSRRLLCPWPAEGGG